MATATLQSFNVFLTDKLTAAAVDIYGFVEKTILDYQEEVNRAKLENQRLRRLLDLVYTPEIKLHRADSMQIELPAPTQEVSAEEQQIEEECIPSVFTEDPVILAIKEEQPEHWTGPVKAPVPPEYGSMKDNYTQVELAAAEKIEDNKSSRSSGAVPTHTKKKSRAKARPSKKKSQSLSCNICGRVTLCNSSMVNHLRTHTGERPFTCQICGKCYSTKSQVLDHIRAHSGVKPYTCFICGKSFKTRLGMKKHAQVKHEENQPFKCMQCSQQFHRVVEFKRHMRKVHNMSENSLLPSLMPVHQQIF
ncbi:zinc finger protein with KRAB and SCAN domains 5-like [Scomber japonicus]|uniref:zinc finger protein with KRAB and SCAN domains 5-like n=1 Tax=Scomber japonicus TaxID=13676 RepID=UPI002306C57C|nr:zinc finger protein with KRAB and SCAN domains 5-like [Scomber japonicus]